MGLLAKKEGMNKISPGNPSGENGVQGESQAALMMKWHMNSRFIAKQPILPPLAEV